MYEPVASALEEAEDSQRRNPELKSGVKVQTGTVFLTLGAHAQEGYCSCLVCVSVCLSVCYHSSGDIVRFYPQNQVLGGCFSWILTRGFSKKPSIRKL